MIVVIKSGGFNLSSAKPTCIARESTPWHDQLIIFGSTRSAKIEFDAFFSARCKTCRRLSTVVVQIMCVYIEQ